MNIETTEKSKKLEHVSLKKVSATLERKDFDFELARNCRGPVVRIIERGPAGRKDMVIAPGTVECIDQIAAALQQLREVAQLTENSSMQNAE
jgi:hypothetical protein